MAVLDPRDDSVVIRIVYDGAPMAGKTTSVGALGRGLGAGVHSPAALDGRTLFFDWLDYTGGLFEGHRIRCQIVSVPGQATLAPRRRRLLESADVVVFVGDSSPEGFDADTRYLTALNSLLQSRSGPPVGVVLQSNKRDLADAVPLERIRELLDRLGLRIGIVESVATEGSGIRETFVFAVRLALDRVRELMRSGALTTAPPDVDSAAQLLSELKAAEGGALDMAVENGLSHIRLQDLNEQKTAAREAPPPTESIAAKALRDAVREEAQLAAPVAEAPAGIPTPPDSRVGSGLIWPPVEGRIMLHELADDRPELARLPCGSWSGLTKSQWLFHSAPSAWFATLDEGREALVAWARAHSAGQAALSRGRCIALTAESGGYRLWQIIRVQPSLRDRLAATLDDSATSFASTLLTVTRSFLETSERLSDEPINVTLSLGTIAADDLSFAGLMPLPSQPAQPRRTREQVHAELLDNLGFIHPALQRRRAEVLPELVKLGASQQLDRAVLHGILQLSHAR